MPLVNFKVSSAKFLKDKFLVSFAAQPGDFVNRGYACLHEATARLEALLHACSGKPSASRLGRLSPDRGIV